MIVSTELNIYHRILEETPHSTTSFLSNHRQTPEAEVQAVLIPESDILDPESLPSFDENGSGDDGDDGEGISHLP